MFDIFNLFSVGFWVMASFPITITLLVLFAGLKMMVRFLKSDRPEVRKPHRLYGRVTAIKVGGRSYWER